MKQLFAVLSAAVLLTACGGHPVRQVNSVHILHNLMSHHLVTVNVGTLRRSGQWGSASIGDKHNGVVVKLDINGEPKGAREAVFLALSSCTPPSRTPWKRLHPVVGGKSKTYIPRLGVGTIKGKKHSIVVENPNGAPVACGDFEI